MLLASSVVSSCRFQVVKSGSLMESLGSMSLVNLVSRTRLQNHKCRTNMFIWLVFILRLLIHAAGCRVKPRERNKGKSNCYHLLALAARAMHYGGQKMINTRCNSKLVK